MLKSYLNKPASEWSEEERAEYEADMREEGVDLSVPPPEEYKEVTMEEIEAIARDLEIDPDPRATAARRRTRRSHMIRKLKERFKIYSPFTAAEAASRLKMTEEELRGFLAFETAMPGTLFRKQGEQFIITSPWVV